MTPTSVGMRCPECAGQTTRVRRAHGTGVNRTFARPESWSDPRSWSLTHVLMAINIAAFLWEVASGLTLGGSNYITSWPWMHGVLYGPAIGHNPLPPSYGGLSGSHEYWRLLTSGFLHESILHIGMNMLSLWFVGRSLEPAIGRLYFGLIYFSALFAGSFGALLFTPDLPSLGASGAIFGLFGALIMVARARRIPLWQSGLLPMLVFNLIFTLTVAGVSIGDHLGGVVAGFASGWLVTEYGEKRGRRSWVIYGCAIIVIVSIFAGIAVSSSGGLLPNGSQI